MADDGRAATDDVTVIVVDDHLMFGESIARLIGRENGVTVLGHVTTIEAAVELVRATVPDVAVVDFHLPDGVGSDAARRIVDVSPETRVLILTGSGDETALVAAIDAGCAGFVTKDRALDELVGAIHATAAGEAYIEPRMLAALLPRFGRHQRGLGSDLTRREREVLGFLAQGLSNQAISEQLVLSVHTVRNHVQSILSKLQAHSKLEAVAIATREGLLETRGPGG